MMMMVMVTGMMMVTGMVMVTKMMIFLWATGLTSDAFLSL